MATIQFTITDEKVQRVKNAIAGLYPIPLIEDPENPGKFIPEFTKGQWAKEGVRRWLIRQVQRWETVSAVETAKENVVYEDDLVS